MGAETGISWATRAGVPITDAVTRLVAQSGLNSLRKKFQVAGFPKRSFGDSKSVVVRVSAFLEMAWRNGELASQIGPRNPNSFSTMKNCGRTVASNWILIRKGGRNRATFPPGAKIAASFDRVPPKRKFDSVASEHRIPPCREAKPR